MASFPEDVYTELTAARLINPSLNSLHEAWAVLFEELDELWDEVRLKPAARRPENARKELIQIAAMAWRTAIDLDLCSDPNDAHKVSK